MNLQPTPSVIVNEAQLSEPIHEKTDPRAGCVHHLCARLLTDFREYSLGHTFLTEVSKQQQGPASLFSLELKSWSTKSSSYRMFRPNKWATNISAKADSRSDGVPEFPPKRAV